MMTKSGDLLLHPNAIAILKEQIVPLSTLITPNIPEAQALTRADGSMDELAARILDIGAKAVLLKGGHSNNPVYSNDLFLEKNAVGIWLESERIDSKNTHGTGCTLSAAIAAFLAQGKPLIQACHDVKRYLSQAIFHAKHHRLGKGKGAVHHFYQYF